MSALLLSNTTGKGQMEQPRILHIRLHSKKYIDNRVNPKGISNFGGATIAYGVIQGKGLAVAVSRCRHDENFRKKYGRNTARHRFNNGVVTFIECFNVETIEQCVRRWYDETFGDARRLD